MKLEEYIESLKEKEEVKEEKEEEKSIIDKIIDFYIENIVYTGIATIAILGIAGYYIGKKVIERKNRIKIDFKG